MELLLSEFLTNNFSGSIWDFHFLRPQWLLLIIAAMLLPFLFQIKSNQDSDWEQALPAHLLSYLSTGHRSQLKKASPWIASTLLVLISLALAGPSWNKAERPVQQVQDDLVIVLDLSLSMYATDLSPNRITRARQKIQDILESRDEGQTALIVYSADAHVVAPLTEDNKTLLAMLPSLEPFIMPAAGSETAKAINSANDLLNQSGSENGKVLLVTDGIEAFQVEEILSALGKTDLSILSVGTKAGAPIDLPERGYLRDGNTVVVAGNNTDNLKKLASETAGKFVTMTLTDKDINELNLAPSKAAIDFNDSEQTQTFSDWQDRGYVLILPLILVVLLAYRKGVLSIIALPALIIAGAPSPVQASLWDDLWATDNQQAYRLMENNNPSMAAQKFEDPAWKGTAHYQAAEYDQSVNAYKNSEQAASTEEEKAEAIYNTGTALAKAQKFEEALEHFEKVLDSQPEHQNAQHNKQIVEKILESLENQQQSGDSKENQDNQSKDSENKESENENSESSNSENSNSENSNSENNETQQNQDQNADNSQDSGEQQSNENQSQDQQSDQSQQSETAQENQDQQNNSEQSEQNQAQANSSQSPEEDSEKEDQRQSTATLDSQENLSEEEQQAFEQWMRRVPDDPSGLLRRKFAQQHQMRGNDDPRDNRPLW